MTRKSIVLALALFSTAAAAEWKTVAESAIGQMLYDTSSVHPQGSRMQLRYRIDFAAAAPNAGARKPASAVMDVTIDCPARAMGLVSFTTYDQAAGKGNVIDHQAFANPAMDAVRAQSTGVPLLKAACGEKTEPHPAPAPPPASAPPAPATQPKNAPPPTGKK